MTRIPKPYSRGLDTEVIPFNVSVNPKTVMLNRLIQIMRTPILLFFLFLGPNLLFSQGRVNSREHYVPPYVKSNGTVVQGHYRTNPNSTNRDNFSTQGNTNPHTGKPGWIQPDNNYIPYSPPTPVYERSTTPTNYSTNKPYYSTPTTYQPITPNDRSLDHSNYYSLSSTPNTIIQNYDLTSGERVINYSNGRDEFSVSSSKRTSFKKGYTYYSYNVYNNEIKESVGSAEGQLLLNGPYKFYNKSGKLAVAENYKLGLKHGKSFSYDDYGNIISIGEYAEGDVIYKKFTDETGITFEILGGIDKPGSKLKLYKQGHLYKNIQYQGNGRAKHIEYDEVSQNKIYEYEILDDEFDGLFCVYHTDGITLLESTSYLKGKLHGKHLVYFPNGKLQRRSIFKDDVIDGPFEYYNESGILIAKGTMNEGELSGELLKYDENGLLSSKENYLDGKRDGLSILYEDSKPIVTGAYEKGEKHGRWNYYWKDSSSYFIAKWLTYEKGILNGSFRDVRQDSVLIGFYKNGLLHGDFNLYYPFKLWLTGIPPQHISEEDISCKGKYLNGKKTGHWKYYYVLTNSLLREGDYTDDLEHGEWRYYMAEYSESKTSNSGNQPILYLKKNYLNGKKNGRSERYAYFDEVRVPCDTTIGTVNPLDTCYTTQYINVHEISYYKNDELHGPFEERDSNGILLSQGEYRFGKKMGKWIETYTEQLATPKVFRFEILYNNDEIDGLVQKFDAVTNHLISEGNFSHNKKIGTWKTYYPDEKKRVFNLESYTDGAITSSRIFDYAGNLLVLGKYLEGNLESLEHYDSTHNCDEKIDLIHLVNGDATFRVTLNGNYISQSHLVWAANFQSLEFDPFMFYETYKLMVNTQSVSLYQSGPYKVTQKSGKVISEGLYIKDKKQGEWNDYFYEQNVLSCTTFQDGEKKSEKFTKLSNSKPFSGKLKIPLSNGEQLVIKIKKGLRNGYTLRYDASGNLIKKVEYSNGVKTEKKTKE